MSVSLLLADAGNEPASTAAERKRHYQLLTAVAVATVAALLQMHGNATAQAVAAGLTSVLIAATLWNAELGLAALFPLLYSLPVAPRSIGTPEILFAALMTVVLLRSMTDNLLTSRLLSLRQLAWGVLAVGGLLVGSWLVARQHGVSPADWFRGLAPFVFLGIGLPAWLCCRRRPEFRQTLLLAVGITSFGFCCLVLYRFVEMRLWEPFWFQPERGIHYRILADELHRYPAKTLVQGAPRVALYERKASDPLVPLALALGLGLAALAERRLVRRLGLCLALTGTAAIVLTITRSMLLCSVFTTAIMSAGLVPSGRSIRRRCLVTCSLMVCTGILVLSFSGIGSAIGSRHAQLPRELLRQLTVDRAHWTDLESSIGSGKANQSSGMKRSDTLQVNGVSTNIPIDGGVHTRLLEYRIAWEKFLESPVFGQGLGVQHEIVLPTRNHRMAKQSVGFIHNWPFYTLMTGGVVGTLLYCVLLLGPAVLAVRAAGMPLLDRTLVASSILLLTTFGLFFVTFRQISCNLLLAVLWTAVLTPAARSQTQAARPQQAGEPGDENLPRSQAA